MKIPGHWNERLRAALRRARERPGPERDTLLLLIKSALAGVFSWSLAAYLIASPQPTYAPFTALLVVQSTAYRSLLQSARYVLAVVLGVLAAGFVGPLLGENPGAFAVMLAVTLTLGRWQRLGSQGLQVSVAGVFAYNALSGTHESMLGEIVMMALLGAGVGLGVSLLILPPLRYRTAARGIEEISGANEQLLGEMADGLAQGLPERETLESWLYRARQLDNTVTSAREAIESGAESVVYNPRKFLRATPRSFEGHRALVEALARAGEQIRSISYGLLRMCEMDPEACPDDAFLCAYAELLGVVSRAAGEVARLDEDADDGRGDAGPLRRTLEEGRRRHNELTASVEGRAAWPSHGVLLTDADRLLEEFAHAGDLGTNHSSSAHD
ncbi:FUSC family protein [Streptomyces iconiensis]|uniref:Aromatic acid exporter family protein n=1 Tax=Streptomyces iconiensis TaxID=1384038 RepID=A0ABT7A0N9_9ACTN|nr:aromatic acid exporter family protein [Streptomyces iconiensis]MDJ1134886.1 aromatic acid exporter family protein [Streptomyces iconiensis]